MTNNSYCSIDSIIAAYFVESEQPDTRRYKVWQLAFRGIEQLGLDFFYQIKSVKLPINSNKTVSIPLDYLNYTKVGILNGVGEIIPLKYNNSLTTYADLSPDRKAKTEDNKFFNYYQFNVPIWFNYWNGGGFVNLYGLSGETVVGTFKIDITNNVILLGENFCYDYLMLEYVASPLMDNEYYVPVQFKEALIAYIGWKDIANLPTSSHFNLGDKRDRKNNFYNERRLAIARYKPLQLEEKHSVAAESQRLTIKL